MPKQTAIPIVWSSENTPQDLSLALRTLSEVYPIGDHQLPADANATDPIRVVFESIATEGESVAARIVRTGDTATISYSSQAMAVRAVGSLMAGLVPEGGRMVEESGFTTFGIMLDCSRNAVVTVTHFKTWLRRLALLGFNMAMLYTEDTYVLPDEPYFGYLRGAYIADELREIDSYAASLGIEMIPCIQTLGHLEQPLRWHAYGDIKDTSNVMLVDEDKTYELISKMLDFWKQVYTSKRVHIGMDETAGLGRGRFIDKHGPEPEPDIYMRHLNKVTGMCCERGLEPMIWSDRVLCMGSAEGYYEENSGVPDHVAQQIPQALQLVYWDYYDSNKEHYVKILDGHRQTGFEPIMASAAHTPWRFWYDRNTTEAHAGASVDACKEIGIKEIFFTMWGDDGAYCNTDSVLAGLAFVAETAFSQTVDQAAIADRFAATCGMDYDFICLASGISHIPNSPCVLWDDPLLGIYLQSRRAKKEDALHQLETEFKRVADQLDAFESDADSDDVNHARLLARSLEMKTGLARRLTDAYIERDQQELRRIQQDIPAMIAMLRETLSSFRKLWYARNKPLGFEVIQIRFGGLFVRFQELNDRLGEYLDGEADSIPELEANLPRAPAPLGTTPYRSLATGSVNF